MDDAAAVSKVLDDRPELEPALKVVLEVDDETDTWTFDDVPVDSGVFGELVSRGLVERTDDGDAYRVADPTAVRAALAGQDINECVTDATSRSRRFGSFPDSTAVMERMAALDVYTVGSLLGALLVVVFARAYVYGSVFRDGAVVLSGNDPYYYRYWVEQALAASGGTLDVSGLTTMSNAVQTGEPLLVATLWAFASLFGGDATTAGWVLAWYPVVAAVITAYLAYRLTMVVTDDRRVALAALVLLAITPAHAFRTSLGFADHHAFDYVWLMVTAYALVRLDRQTDTDWRKRGKWVWTSILGVGIGGQILAWDAGPLLIVPLAIYVAVRVLQDVRSDRAPLAANLPLLGGVAFATVLVYIGHTQVGWHSETVAFSPVLLTLGVLGVLGTGELAHRFDVSIRVLTPVEIVGVIMGMVTLRTLRPGYWAELMAGVGRIVARRDIAETQSLLSGDTFGWLLLFGFVLALAVPFLAWGTVEAYRGEHIWLVPAVYCWYFLALAIFQVRFAGQLAMLASLFAGLGFVYLAAAVDLTDRPVPFTDDLTARPHVSLPSWRLTGQMIVLFVLVGGLSFVQVPIKTSQVTTDEDAYRTAAWMDEYADEQGWEYPDNYVFSRWGENRMYNYFVNGESQSYVYAQQHYGLFLAGSNLTNWHDQLDGRTGFIVTKDGYAPNQGTIYSHLHEHYGGSGSSLQSTGQFRAVYQTTDGSYKVFTPVTGALIAGRTSSTESGVVSADVDIPESSFVYERQVTGAENRWYMIRVPYPTVYDLTGNDSVAVSESEIRTGSIANTRSANATWPLSATQGDFVFDHTGGNHGRFVNGEWAEDNKWTGLSFNGSSYAWISDGESINGSDGFTLSVRFRTRENVDYEQELQYPRIVSKAPSRPYANTSGYQIAMSKGRILGIVGNGTSATRVWGGTVTGNTWYNATLVWNGSTVRFYLNGEQVDTASFTGSPGNDVPLVFGASSDRRHHFIGTVDWVTYREH